MDQITLCTAAGLSIVLHEPQPPTPKTPETDLAQLMAQLDDLKVSLERTTS